MMFRLPMFTMTFVTIFTLPLIVKASPVSHSDDIPPRGKDLLSRVYDPTDCRLWATTNPWTTCKDFIAQYNISLPDLYTMNPSIEYDCYKFRPGTSYCLRMPSNYPVTTDGQCGRQASLNTTCIGSTFGDCCGSTGQCGATDAFCAIGKCQAGQCPGLGYSTDGLCGSKHGNLMCGGSLGNCCSNSGKCGSTTVECAAENCESGACLGTSTTSSTSGTSSPTAVPSPFSPSPDGTCGYLNQYKCTDTKYYFGNCCGAAGYCGTSAYECNDQLGCQPLYGLCDKTIIVTVTGVSSSSASTTSSSTSKPVSSSSSKSTTSSSITKATTSSSTSKTVTTSTSSAASTSTISLDGKCGSASSVNATCKGSTFGSCCSAKGNCGTSDFFCAVNNACQPKFGICNPISIDGKCGSASSSKASCSGSSFGGCCSVKGNCGSSDFFCAVNNECQLNFGACNSASTDGKCGSASSTNASCSGSAFGSCCSVKGNCGTSDFFCAVDNLCQLGFGKCNSKSLDGKCGAASSTNASCSGSSFGKCCSVKGNCGEGVFFCATANLCQPAFGLCT